MKQWEEWQKPYQSGTIVIKPPSQVRAVVDAQRKKYDPVSHQYSETHISVTQPLLGKLAESEWDHLQNLLADIKPFQIDYGPLNSFLPYPCIWYEIEPRDQILALRKTLHQTGYFNLGIRHPENFIPHMTITEGLSGPTVDDRLLLKLKEESGTGSFQCEDLVLIVPDGDFHFHVRRRLALGLSP
jgi:2'-5' RNA ligase